MMAAISIKIHAVIALCSVMLATHTQAAEPQSSGKQDVVLTRQSYEQFQTWLKSQQGKIVVVDCWATYCGPCKKEFPRLVALSESLPAAEVVCASLSFDYDESATPAENDAPVLEFLKAQRAANVRNVLVTLDPDELNKNLGLVSIPTVLVFDRTGNKTILDGSTPGKKFDYAQVEALVETLRKQK